MVSGSEIYTIKIAIALVAAARWKAICARLRRSHRFAGRAAAGQARQGRDGAGLPAGRRAVPGAEEIKLACSCPDWADMCKHVAAVLYGVGARLDSSPSCCSCCAESTTRTWSSAPARCWRRRSVLPQKGRCWWTIIWPHCLVSTWPWKARRPLLLALVPSPLRLMLLGALRDKSGARRAEGGGEAEDATGKSATPHLLGHRPCRRALLDPRARTRHKGTARISAARKKAVRGRMAMA